jgi:hypothetical protein
LVSAIPAGDGKNDNLFYSVDYTFFKSAMSKLLHPPPPGIFGEAVLMTAIKSVFFLLRLNINSESTVLLSSPTDGATKD